MALTALGMTVCQAPDSADILIVSQAILLVKADTNAAIPGKGIDHFALLAALARDCVHVRMPIPSVQTDCTAGECCTKVLESCSTTLASGLQHWAQFHFSTLM